MAEADDEYYVPLVNQKAFGAGVKRKRIDFVPASQIDVPLQQDVSKNPSLADRYLSIVLPKDSTYPKSIPSSTTALNHETITAPTLCAVCKQPISTTTDNLALNTHESSIAHQVCLTHSHQPSHLDREHVGLRYLTGYGWDPDSRKGLGARQEGITIPIKAKQKHDTTGLKEIEDEEDIKFRKRPVKKPEEPVVRLDAGKLRKKQEEERKRAEKLRHMFYGPDLSQYLGPDG